MSESWESIAHALAARLAHAGAPDHRPPLADCPFCEDALAFARYVAKRKATGRPWRDPFDGMTSIFLSDITPEAAAVCAICRGTGRAKSGSGLIDCWSCDTPEAQR